MAFDGTFVFYIIKVYITMQESSYLGEIVLVSIWYKMVLDPNYKSDIRRISPLDIHQISMLD